MLRSFLSSSVLWVLALVMVLSGCLDWDIPEGYPDGDGDGDIDGDGDGDCDTDEVDCGDGTCIDLYDICDGYPDCPDGADELICYCGDDEFPCGTSGICIALEWVCDGETDCPDGEDEYGCY